MEQSILSAIIKDRKAYDYVKNLLPADDWSPEGGIIFGLVKEYYDADPKARSCDAEILGARARRQMSSNKIAETVCSGIAGLATADVSAINVAKEVVAVKRSTIGNKIASKLASNQSNVQELMLEYQALDRDGILEGSESDEEQIFHSTTAASLGSTSFSSEGLIQLYPLVLNKQIDGGIRGGHHVLIFAPTEMGKSLFVINACYGFLRQGKRVLYVGNEDPAADILMRMMTRLLERSKYDILANPDKADEALSKRNWDKFIFANLSPGTFQQIDKLVEKYEPEVVVLDQLRNISVAIDQRTQALERVATEARNLAKRRHVPVLSVTQAADSASGKTILSRGDVDGSNVGIPGQVDLMIGMGATEEMEERNLRTLSFAKNKLSGNHSPIQIQIDPFTSRILE